MFKKEWLFSLGILVTILLTGCQPLFTAASSLGEARAPNAPTETIPLPERRRIPDLKTLTATLASLAAEPVSEATITSPITLTVTDTPLAAPAQPTRSQEARITVVTAALRLRTGPGIAYPISGATGKGEQYPILGQADDCQWYLVHHAQLGAVWLSGDPQYVRSNTDCHALTAAIIPPLPAPTATLLPTVAAPPTPTTPSTENVIAANVEPLPAEQGCLILQNQLGPELTFTFTRADDSWRDVVKVTTEQDLSYCLIPGRYRMTIDAPPPWLSINQEITIQVGMNAYLPIRPQQ
ncbi:MAG: hypothetical protein KF832_06425 [Caldilineaceae bacterium]|nr:hypothetical protein [Caldilineaceae bacterium]